MKICKKCGTKLPEDSKFCQYCGSPEVVDEEVQTKDINKETPVIVKQKYKMPLIVVSILVVGLTCALIWGAFQYNKLKENYNNVYSENKEMQSENANLKSTYNNWDDLLDSAYADKPNSSFYATSTVLYKPKKARVVLYLDTYNAYTINYSVPYGATITSGNTENGNVYLDITCQKDGIRVVKVTNSINDEVIHIYLVGE